MASLRRPALAGLILLSATLLAGCGYVVPIGGALVALLQKSSSKSGGVVVIRDTTADLVVSRGPFDVGDTTEGRAATNVVLAQVRLLPTKDTLLRKITVGVTGTGDASSIPSVKLFQDVDGDGALSAKDKQLGTTTRFSGASAVFAALDASLKGGVALDLLVVIDTPQSAKDGDTFQLSIATADALDAAVAETVGSAQEKQANVLGVPVVGGKKTISSTGSLRLFVGPNSPPNQAVFPNAQGVGLLQVELRASSAEQLRATKLTLRTSGSGDDSVDIARASLYVDTDGDGKLTLGVDQPIVLSVVPSSNDGALVFDGLAQTIDRGEIVRWLVVYDLKGTAVDGATFRVDLQANSDLEVTGLTSQGPIVPTGAPLDGGATLTVTRASLAVAAGPFNPNRTATPGQTNVPMLQLALTAGPAEPVVVSGVAVVDSGTGDAVTELSGVRLYVDQNGDGIVNPGETLLAGPASFPVVGGKLVLSGFTRAIAAGATENWIVSYDVASVASGGHGFQIALSGPADVQVSGQRSALVVTPVAAASGGALTVTGSLATQPGPNNPGAQTPFANDASVPVVQLRVATGLGETMRVRSLTVNPTGTGDYQNGISAVDLVLDADGSGTVTAGDTILATGTFPGAKAPLTFSNAAGLIPGDIAPVTTVALLVRFQLSGQATLGQTFTATVGPNDIAATGIASGLPVVTSGLATSSGSIVAQRARAVLVPGAQNAGDSDVLNGATDVPMLQVQITSGPSEPVVVSSVTIRDQGTANTPAAVQAVQLFIEGVGPLGSKDATDTQLGANQTYSSPQGFVTFSNGGPPLFTLPPNTQANLLVVYQVSPLAVAPSSLRAQLSLATDVTAQGGSSGLSAEILGPPVTGGTKTIRRGSLGLAAGPRSPGPGSVFPNIANAPLLQLQLQAGFAEALRVTSVKVTDASTADPAVAETRLLLVDDQNGDGIVEGFEPVLGTGTIAKNGTLAFAIAPGALDVPAGGTRQVLVATDVAPGAVPPGALRVRIAAASDVTAIGSSSGQAIAPAGAPVDGSAQTIILGSLALATVGTNPPPTVELPSASGVSMIQIKLTAGATESVRVQSLKITHAGTGDPTTGLSATQLYNDANGDGILDGDAFIAATTFSGGTATFTKVGGLIDVPANGTAFLLVAHQFSGSVPDGATFQVKVALASDVSVVGNSSNVSIVPTGLPVSGPVKTIQTGKLALGAGAQNPAPTTVFANQADIPITQVLLTAGPAEPIRVTNVTITAAGTGDSQTGVTRVRLYRENDPANGVLDGDFLLGTASNFGAGGKVTFTIAPGQLDVPAGGTKNLLVVEDLGGTASVGQTFGAQLATSGDLSAVGVVSSLSVTPTGVPPAVSGQVTVKQATLGLARGPNTPGATNVFRTKTNVPVLQVRLAAGSAEAVRVGSVKLTASGSLDASSGVVKVQLFRDDNSDGLVNGDFLLGTATNFSGGTVNFAINPGDLVVAAGQTKDVLVAVDFGGTAADGQTLAVSVAANGDVTGTGVSSGLAAPVSGAPVTGNTLTVIDRTLTVSNGFALPSPTAFSNATGQRALSIELDSGAIEGVRVTSVTIRGDATQTAPDAGTRVKLYLDANQNGTVDAADTLIASAVYSGTPGAVTLGVAGSVDIPTSSTAYLLATYDLAGVASANQTYRAQVGSADVVGQGLLSGVPVVIQGGPFPITGPTITVQSTTLSLASIAATSTATRFQNATDVPMVRFDATAGALEGVRVTGLTITPQGSGDATLASVRLYLDTNANGTFEAGTDVLVGGPQPGNNAGIVFTNATGLADIPPGGTVHFLAVYDFTSPPPAGATYAATVSATNVVAKGLSSGAAVAATGGPFTGGTQTIVQASLALSAPAQVPAANQLRNATGVSMLRFTATAGPAETVSVTSLTLAPTGASTGNAILAKVSLYVDTNGDGLLQPATDTLIAGPITASGAGVTFQNPTGLFAVPAGGSVQLLAVYDFAGTPAAGLTFDLQLVNGSVVAKGASSALPVAPTGGGFAGGLQTIVQASLALSVGAQVPAANDLRDATGVPMLRVRATAGGAEPVRITRITVRPTAASTGDATQASVRLYLDANGDGLLQPASDVLLGGPVAGVNGDLSFDVTGTADVASSSTASFLVVYDFASPPAGKTFDLMLSDVDVVAAGRTSGLTVSPSGGSFQGGLQTIVESSLALSVTAQVPAAPRLQGSTSVPMLRFVATAGSAEPVRITGVTVHAGGTGAPALTSVKLYVDVNANGTVEPGTDILVGGPTPGSAAVTFSNAGGLVDIPASGSVAFLVADDLGSPPPGATFTLSVSAPDVAAKGVTSGLATPIAGGPFTGGAQTIVQAVLTLSDTAQIATGTVLPNAAFVPMLRVKATAGSAEAIRVTDVSVAPSAASTGDDTHATARLWLDVNGDGVVEPGTDVLLAGPLAGTNAGVTFSNAGGLADIAASGAVDLLVTYDLDATPPAGAVFDLGATSAGFTAKGLASNLPAVVSGGPFLGSQQTVVRGALTVSAPVQVAAGNVFPTSAGVSMLRFRATAGPAEGIRISQLVMHPQGSGAPTNATARLYLDRDASGTLTGVDTQLGGSVVGAVTSITFAAAPLIDIPANATRDFLVVYDLNGAPSAGDQFGLSADAPDFTATGLASNVSVSATAAGGPFTGGLQTVALGSIALGPGSSPPADRNVFASQTNVALSQVSLQTGAAEAVRVSSVRFFKRGGTTLDAQTGLSNVRLVLDNGDGQLGVGDTVLDVKSAFAGTDDVTFSLTPGTLDIPPGTTVNLLLVADLAGSGGQSFAADVATTDIVASGLGSAKPLTTQGSAEGGALLTLVQPPAVTIANVPVVGTAVNFGATNVPMLQLHVSAANGDVVLEGLNVTAAGSGDDANDVTFVKLWKDADASGTVSGGDTQLGLAKYFADDGVAGFGGLSLTIAAGSSVDLLVTYDMGDSAHVTAGKTYQATVKIGDAAFQAVIGGLPVTPAGLPQSGTTRTVPNPSLTAAPGPSNPSGSRATRDGETGVVLLQAALGANLGDVTVTQMTVSASGTGNDATGVASLAIVRDVDGDGTVSAGDVEIARLANPFAADNGSANVTGLSELIPAGTTAQYLVVYDMTTAPPVNATFAAAITGITAAPATVTGLPVAGRSLSIVGGLTASLAANNPAGVTLTQPQAQAAVFELALTADAAESVNLSSLKITPGGNANPSTTITKAQLWKSNGTTFNAGSDTLLATVSSPFSGPLSPVTFTSLGQTIAAGGTLKLFVTVDTAGSPPAQKGVTFRLSFASNGDASATGATSNASAFVSGAAVTGATFQAGASQTLFSNSPSTIGTFIASNVQEVATGDFNLDGKQDYVLLMTNGQIEVHLGNGDGTFSSSINTAGAVTSAPVGLAVADMNGDGFPDVVVAYSAGNVRVFLNSGAGTFPVGGIATYPISGATLTSLVLVDYDRDGKTDVVCGDTTKRLVGLRNLGGTLSATADSVSTPSGVPKRLVAADFDRDGFVDVAFYDDATTPNLVLAKGTGTFFTVAATLAIGGTPSDLAALDGDRNGYPDVVVVDSGANTFTTYKNQSPSVVGFANTASGSGTTILLTTPSRLVAGDWNGDGKPDFTIVYTGTLGLNQGIAVHPGDGTLNYPVSSVSNYSGGNAPDRIVAADFNGDGDPDILVASSTTGTVTLFLGDGLTGGGTGQPATPATLAWSSAPSGVAVGDLNRDGQIDYVLISNNDKTYSTWLDSGTGTFTKKTQGSVFDDPSFVRTADVNRDGKLDMIVAINAGGSSKALQFFPGNGDGTFGATATIFTFNQAQPSWIALGDVNGDAKVDAVVACKASNVVQVFRGTGAASGFTASASADSYATTNGPVQVELGDVNRDGKLDMVILTSGGKKLEVRLGNGDGTFGAATTFALDAAIGTPGGIALADFDRDGKLDAVVFSSSATQLQAFRGNGDGTFSALSPVATTTKITEVHAGDMNKDGLIDVVALSGNGQVTFFKNTGNLTFATGVTTTGAGGAQLVSLDLADVDGDGELDVIATDQSGNKATEIFLGQ